MKPICIPCQRFFKPKKNGYYFLEGMPAVNEAVPGNTRPECWTPYKLWVGDLFECPGCGAQILSGFSQTHIAEHYQRDFEAHVKALHADQFQVNDC